MVKPYHLHIVVAVKQRLVSNQMVGKAPETENIRRTSN